MANSCIIKPCVRNSKGELTESKLFNDLLSHLPKQRTEVWAYYEMAIDPKFKDTLPEGVRFDDNGEILFRDFAEVVGLTDEKIDTLKALNQELKAGIYGFQDSIEKVAQFNRNSLPNSKYMAILSATNESGKFAISVVERSSAVEEALANEVAGWHMTEQLRFHLAQAGVSASFIDEDYSRYSTKNAEKNANGLYELIEFSKNKHGIKEYSEEAGHLIVGTMTNSPLLSRMMDLITPEMVDTLLGKDRPFSESAIREAAGVLVGQVLHSELKYQGPIGKLINRLIQASTKIFSKLSSKQVRQDIIQAKEIGKQFVEQFLTGKLERGAEEAIKTVETLYNRARTEYEGLVYKLSDEMARVAEELRIVQPKISELLEQALNSIQLEALQMHQDHVTVQALIPLLSRLVQISDLVIDTAIKGTGGGLPMYGIEATKNLQDMAKSLVAFEKLSKMWGSLSGEFQNFANSRSLDLEQAGDPIKTLDSMLSKTSATFNRAYKAGARKVTIAWLQRMYGARHVARQLNYEWFDWKKVETETIDLEKIVDILEEDDAWGSDMLASLANSVDLGAQFLDSAIKGAYHAADQQSIQDSVRLKELEKKAKDLNINTSKFYEKDEDGHLTGNLVTLVADNTNIFNPTYKIVSTNDYEKAYKTEIEKLLKEYSQTGEGQYILNMPPRIRKIKFNLWAQDKLQEWHKNNTVTVTDVNGNSIHVLKNNSGNVLQAYNSKDADRYFKPHELDWYLEYLKTWTNIRSRIGKTMSATLAPQVKAKGVDTILNRVKYNDSGVLGASAKQLMESATEMFERQDEALDVQEHNEYYSEQDFVDNFYNSSSGQETTRSRLLPLYYTKKLANPNQLDTNLLASTMQFAIMANKYKALRDIKDTVDVATHTLSLRKEGSRVNKRMEEYVDLHMYGINDGSFQKFLKKVPVLSQLVNVGGNVATLWLLGFNVTSQLANLGTGIIEMAKESIAAGDFNMADFLAAQKDYSLALVHNTYDAVVSSNTSKINLFGERFNLFDNVDQLVDRFRSTGRRMTKKPLSRIAMAGYSIGDHQMQLLPVMAAARHVKLFTIDGTETNLWKTYKIEKNKKSRRVLTRELAFKSKEDIAVYKDIQEAKTALLKALAAADKDVMNNPNTDYLSEDLITYFKKQGYDIPTINQWQPKYLVELLETREKQVIFSDVDEQNFMNKAREITNRMHGIYNRLDSPGLFNTLPGKIWGRMTRYAFGMVEKRYKGLTRKKSYSVLFNDADEGYRVTFFKMMAAAFYDHLGTLFSKELRKERYGTNENYFKIALKELGMAVGTSFVTAVPWLFNINSKISSWTADKLGISTSQLKNLVRNANDVVVIMTLMALRASLKAMASGEDEREELEAMSLQELIEYMRANNLDVTLTPQKIASLKKEAGNNVEYLRDIVKQAIMENIVKIKAEESRAKEPAVQFGYYMINRLFREQAAFNTWIGVSTEARALLDPMPIAVSFARDIYRLADGYFTTEKFLQEYIDSPHFGKVSVARAMDIVRMSVEEIQDMCPNVPKTTIVETQKHLSKFIRKAWVDGEYGTDGEFKNYFTDKRKRGKWDRMTPRWKNSLEMKLPHKKLDYILHEGIQATNDYNFGTRYN